MQGVCQLCQPPVLKPTSHAAPCPLPPPPGKEYAINQLVLFLSITSLECEWDRQRTPQSGENGGSAPPWPPAAALGPACPQQALFQPSSSPTLPLPPPLPLLRATDDLKYLPTIYPADALISLRPRKA